MYWTNSTYTLLRGAGNFIFHVSLLHEQYLVKYRSGGIYKIV